MKIRRIIALAALALAGSLLLLSACGGAAKQGTIKIGAVLAVTGPAGNLGAPEKKTLEMLVADINKNGGVNGQQIQLIVKDTQASADNAVSFTKQLIEEEKVLAIIGPTTSGESLAVKKLAEDNKVILISCAAAESIVIPVSPWVFKTPQNDANAAIMIFKDMQSRNIKKIGIVTANSGFGKGGKDQLEKYASQYGITIVISEVYDSKAADLTDVMTKVKNMNVEAVVNWSIEPAQSIVIKNMRQIGMKQPLYQSHGFGNLAYVQAAGPAAEGVLFPAGRMLVADVLPADHPQKKVLTDYKNAYESKYNEPVSTFGGHAYDALMILIEAIKKAGSTDKEAVRAALEKITGFAGTGGIFNYSATDHNGLDITAFEMLTVKDGKFILYTK
ncbi:MAG: ABC transporter substrate-binding protein [Spirochaetaceae bacterium]|nr:MAG: ABC transporter substrate-binding protein [Spirochaetaceae bacterium]